VAIFFGYGYHTSLDSVPSDSASANKVVVVALARVESYKPMRASLATIVPQILYPIMKSFPGTTVDVETAAIAPFFA